MTDTPIAAAAAARIAAAQEGLRAAGIDGWLLYDFQGKNPIFWQLLGIPRHVTRRLYLFIPSVGAAQLLAHRIDVSALSPFGIETQSYLTWTDLGAALPRLLHGRRRLAMDYSPGCALPVVSRADAGTVELVRSLGLDVVSSGDLIQTAVARWSPGDFDDHIRAARGVQEALEEALAFVRARAGSPLSELDVQQVLLEGFARRGLTTEDPPIVAVNGHAGDPHYEPTARSNASISPGDWLLIDLWARVDRPGTVYADSTWVAFLGPRPLPRHQELFEVVVRARDRAVETIRAGYASGRPVEGWQVDRAARDLIDGAGWGAHFTHRTGHSLGQQVHGPGVNLDDYETHDTRTLIEGVAVTVEPGLYFPDVGVRSEINVVMTSGGPLVTLPEQREITLLG